MLFTDTQTNNDILKPAQCTCMQLPQEKSGKHLMPAGNFTVGARQLLPISVSRCAYLVGRLLQLQTQS